MAETPEDETVNYATRLPADKAEEVEKWRKEESLNKSEAIRTLVRAGLKAEQSEPDPAVFLRVTFAAAAVLLALSTVVAAVTYFALSTPLALTVGLGVVAVTAAVLARTAPATSGFIMRLAGVGK
ncbi:hypothetical protein ACOJIV_25030 [Haloarcula sp. AONF1]